MREPRISRRGFLKAIGAAALALSGINCSTAKYDKMLINDGRVKLMRDARSPTFEPGSIPTRDKTGLPSKTDTKRIGDYAEGLPAVDVDVYYAKPFDGTTYAKLGPERLNLNVANRLPVIPQLRNLEDALPDTPSRPRLVMGDPDSDLPTKLAREYQLSRQSNLFGAEHFGNGEFAIDIKRKTGIKGGFFGRDTNTYRVKITYGEEAFIAEQKLNDDLSVAELGENLLVAWGAYDITRGYVVPLEAAIQMGFDHLFAYLVTSDNPPDSMGYIDQVISSGRKGKENNTISVLRNVQETGAKNLIVFSYKGGSSVLYLGDNVTDIVAKENSIEFTTEQVGLAHLLSFLYRAGSTASRYPPEKVEEKRYYLLSSPSTPTSGGGRDGGPGGFGGGRGGEPGGTR